MNIQNKDDNNNETLSKQNLIEENIQKEEINFLDAKEIETHDVPLDNLIIPNIQDFCNLFIKKADKKLESPPLMDYDLSDKEKKRIILSYESVPNTFISKKKEKLYQETISSFGSEEMVLKKKYSRLEQEKLDIKYKRKNWVLNEEHKDDLPDERDKQYFIEDKKTEVEFKKPKGFLSDAKLNKPKFVLEKEKLGDNTPYKSSLNKKYLNKSEVKEFGGNWDEVMNNSCKKVSIVQREKILYREEVLKLKEMDLKNKEKEHKGEVFKFESIVEEKKDISKLKENKVKNLISVKKLVSDDNQDLNDKICSNCNNDFKENNNVKIFQCGHTLHTKCWLGLRFYQRSDCQQCKKEIKKQNNKDNQNKESEEKKNESIMLNEIIPQTTENFELNALEINQEEK